MPKRTLKDICGIHNITRDILDYARAEGVNVFKDQEMADWVSNRRPRSDSKAPAPGADDSGPVLSLEELEQELAAAPTPQIAQMRKIQISGLREGLKYRQEMMSLISLSEVKERDTKIANAVRSALIKLENDLPPKGVGLDEAGMQKAFRPIITGIMGDLADDQSEFWKEKPEP